MTEAQWLGCDTPWAMLAFLRGKASERKLRLFAVACCRRVSHILRSEPLRRVVEAAERYADRGISAGQLDETRAAAAGGVSYEPFLLCSPNFSILDSDVFCAAHAAYRAVCPNTEDAPKACATALAYSAAKAAHRRRQQRVFLDARGREFGVQCRVLRCIFGLPLRPPLPVAPGVLAWAGGVIPKLAQSIYDERAFDRLPMLADALEEAGCDNEDILAHCRQGGEHARGCWPVDRILAKE